MLVKLAEYKPLAKIEEMEEQNYNMVDNVLNNGAGEKAQKEENKKAQDKPAEKMSLKPVLRRKRRWWQDRGMMKMQRTSREKCKGTNTIFSLKK